MNLTTRFKTRLLLFLLAVFFIAGIYIVEQRPESEEEKSRDLQPKPLNNEPKQQSTDLLHEAQKEAEVQLDPCTAVNHMKGFIDLSGLSSLGPDAKPQPWVAHGTYNFTIGVCLSPFKEATSTIPMFKDVLDPASVGAYYLDASTKQYILLGKVSQTPKFTGNKLSLTYEDGSFCESILAKDGSPLRRSTILNFRCDHEMLNKAAVSHVASALDCTYIFEIRSHFACPTAAKADNLAAIWIFLLILFAAFLVFFSGSYLFNNLKSAPVAI